ncbi:MAG TPA: peptidylprolyl isomerase [Minicystis sp.]|nr:peptidylprolyl isomerase [Minicystis sp.]
MPSRARTLGLAAAVAVAVAVGAPRPARAVIVERVVAVVGDRPILLSELEARTRPFRIQIVQKVPPGPQRAAANDQINREMLQKMIDEELEQQAAEHSHIAVTSDEVDNAFKNIAASQNLTVADLFREARTRSGLAEQDYRDEIRRQILEGKMLQLRVKGHIRISEEDVRQRYDRAVREERHQREYHPAWIVLRILPGSSPEAVAERMQLAQQIAARATAGEDFAALAKAYSDDSATRDSGGDLGVRAPRDSPPAQQGKRPVLAKELEDEVMKLETGEVSPPVRSGEGVVVMKLISRQASHYTSFKDSRNEIVAMLQQEQFDHAKRKWLDELKTRTHIEVRL